MHPRQEQLAWLTRRAFFGRSALGLGIPALASLLGEQVLEAKEGLAASGGLPELPHFAPKAKRVIYLFQSGAPSQLDLFDYKPKLEELRGQDLPESIRQGQRLTGMTSGQKAFPIAPSMFKFAQHGQSGAWISELMPQLATVADELCFIKSMHTEAINHDPAVTFMNTGAQLAGRPSFGAWVSYGLGSENQDLPAFVSMISRGTGRPNDQPLYDRLWGSGFLPSRHQGVKFRSVGDPVLFLSNPAGVDADTRRRMLDDLGQLNQFKLAEFGDPEIATRIAQYELAYRMQTSVPELTDVSGEPNEVFESYGPDSRRPGTFAANCLLARRLAERGVRFIQLFHMGWDQHSLLPTQIRGQC
ncbi:MAG TPA: DUF1501 domain-containing protein, partial [Pirellulales bacterium]|nr:DUF1501 domain-containing protein [Pirellulales bacterium]